MSSGLALLKDQASCRADAESFVSVLPPGDLDPENYTFYPGLTLTTEIDMSGVGELTTNALLELAEVLTYSPAIVRAPMPPASCHSMPLYDEEGCASAHV